MFNSEAELLASIQATAKSLNKILTDYKATQKSLEKLENTKSLERQDYLADAVEMLRKVDLARMGCGEKQKEIDAALSERLRALRANAHHNLITGLTKLMDKPEQLKILSDTPLVIYMHPLTLEVNFEQSKCQFTYAHEPLATTSLEPSEIISVHAAQLDYFRSIRIDSSRFWEICRLAYDMVLLKNGQPAQTHVNIVELLPALSWIWPNQGNKKLSPFPRFLLAYQLQKLRADKMLQNHNFRLDLGTATGGSTKNKANVLYVPLGGTDGQYYLSICFRQV